MNHWRQSIDRIYATRTNAAGTESRPIFFPPASVLDIEIAEHQLGARFPDSLKSLLLESDGIMDQLSVDGSPFFDNLWVVWPVRQIVDENIAFRRSAIEKRLTCAGQEVVYIASAGVDGILFGIEATFKQRDDAQIVSWYPIGQRTSCLADTLGGFLDGWLCNRISV